MRNDGVLHPNEHKSKLFATMRPSSSLPHLDLNNYSLYIIPCHQIRNNFPNPLTSHLSINVITVPPKFWRKKSVNKYNPKSTMMLMRICMYSNPLVKVWNVRGIIHLIHVLTSFMGKICWWLELLRDLHIGNDVGAVIRNNIINIIHNSWDSFCERGVLRPILDFEFCIVTDNSPPVCCRQPVYGFYELTSKLVISLLIVKVFGDLCFCLQQSLIRKIVRISTPSFGDFVSAIDLCIVLFLSLRSQYLIVLIVSKTLAIRAINFQLFFLDARSGYHQIRVRDCDKEKLTLFTPSRTKKTYKVLPFGSTNAPAFYTVMMQSLRKEWLLLFARLNSAPVSIVYNDKIIIDDILLYSNHINTLIHYFSCVSQVFTVYCLSFKLKNVNF